MKFSSHSKQIRFLILVCAILLLWFAGSFFHIDTIALRRSLEGFPLLFAGVIYVLLYVSVTFFVFFSKDIFWLVGALLFGAVYSALLVTISEILNACILFYLSRRLGRAYVEKSMTARFARLDEKLGRTSFLWLFVFRAAPLIPFRFLDLAAGLTGIRFAKYILAVALGSPLKIFWIQHILAGLGQNAYDPVALGQYFAGNKGLLIFSFTYIILVAAAAIKIGRKG